MDDYMDKSTDIPAPSSNIGDDLEADHIWKKYAHWPIVQRAGTKMFHYTGAHPYNVTPEHTAMAREVMGPEAGLYVEQKVMLTEDAAQAREAMETPQPHYRHQQQQQQVPRRVKSDRVVKHVSR